MSFPILIESRPAEGGIEFVYQIGDDRASALASAVRIEYPHLISDLGASLDRDRDELVRLAARADFERARAAAILAGLTREAA